MSDLSLPPLNFSTDETLPMPLDARPASPFEAFKWPSPPLACYPEAQRQSRPEPIDVEGIDGQIRPGKLMSMTPEAGVAHVQVLPARAGMPLGFAQFRMLSLRTPLQPFGDHATAFDAGAIEPFRVDMNDGSVVAGRTVGYVQHDFGLFLFKPLDDAGSVRRVFIPRIAYRGFVAGTAAEGSAKAASSAAPRPVHAPAAVEPPAATAADGGGQGLGGVLANRPLASADELMEAIAQQARMPMVRIGEALIALGLITDAQLQEALTAQKADRSVPLGQILVIRGIVSKQDLQTALARKMGYPVVDAAHFQVEVEALRKLPFAVAVRLNALPLLLRAGKLVIALEDPSRFAVIEELEFVTQAKVTPVLAMAAQIAAALPATYERFGIEMSGGRLAIDASGAIDFDSPQDASKLVESLELQVSQSEPEGGDDDSTIEQSDNSLVRLINTMIIDAASQGVSDIHIECQPGREKLKIRFRKDGLLRPYLELPHTYRNALVSRIKVMCDLDISERRKPQDGKINFARFSQQHRLELRVATIPTANNLEDVVLRILASAKPLPLDKLGVSPHNYERLLDAIQRPYGMVLCVGPTGSGKTTTLHSALAKINTPERKIWTTEDPVEITQAGLRQVQVNPKIDWTFAKALRAFLRADPDVIMVGEIRDEETAQMAVEASLTGHLVLSTLHTNSAPETVTRLLDMGMDPFNFADALLAVLAQRLVRRLCAKCRIAEPASETQIDELLDDYLHAYAEPEGKPEREALRTDWLGRFGTDGRLMHYHSPGCGHCDSSGFKGRVGLHELLTMSRSVRRLIQTGGRVEQLQAAGLAEGMRTLRQDGIEKVLQGLTTIEEVRATSNAG